MSFFLADRAEASLPRRRAGWFVFVLFGVRGKGLALSD